MLKKAEAIAANRAAWNQSATYHKANEEFAGLLEGFGHQPGFSSLDSVATVALEKIGVQGKRVAQICCNKGSEILSIENMGALDCVGFDFSGEFLVLARQLANAGGLNCQFVESNAYEIPCEFDKQFNVCVITIGVFGWMPEIDGFFRVVARLMKPGGRLLVYEEHPIMNMFEPRAANPMVPANSYFQEEPFEEDGLILYDGSDPGTAGKHYWFVHPLANVLNACIQSGIRIDSYDEYPHNISSAEFDVYGEQDCNLPMSYILTGTLEE